MKRFLAGMAVGLALGVAVPTSAQVKFSGLDCSQINSPGSVVRDWVILGEYDMLQAAANIRGLTARVSYNPLWDQPLAAMVGAIAGRCQAEPWRKVAATVLEIVGY